MFKKIFFLFLLFVLSGNVNAQCSITGNVYSSTRTCSSFSTCPIIYIGDGTTNTSLILNGNLDLTTCSLGPIQIIVNPNANIDFSDQNYDLRLPAGSSITFIGSGTLISPGGCSASDRIVIGGTVVANCLGSGPPLSFPELVGQGGFNIVNISPSSASACESVSFSFTAIAVPVTTGASGTVIKWYSAATGTSSLLRTGTAGSASDTYTTPPISATTTYYAEATTGSFTTPRKAVVATIKPLPVTAGIITGTATVCQGQATVSYYVPAIANATSYTWAYSGTGALFTNGTTRTPTITFMTNATSGNLTVYGVNACGNGTISANYAITVNPTTVGGTISGGTTPICQGSNTATLTLSGQLGTIVQWERQVNSGGWSSVGNGGSSTYSEVPFSAGTWQYRTLVQSGICTSSYSSIQTIVVYQTPVGGGVYSGNTPVCINSSTGNMTLGGGYIGTVVRWEKRLLPVATWTSISNTTTVYSESPSVAGTWEYRAVVGSGTCPVVYSSAFSVTVNPVVTITLGTNPTVAQGTTSVNLPYTANNAAQVYVTFNAAAAAAGFTASQNTSLSGASGNIVLQVPYCPTAGAGTYSGTLYVRTFSPDCISTSYPFSVTITSSAAPTGTASQAFCSGATVANLTATGTVIQWYGASSGVAALAFSTVLVNGNHYYASQNPAGCESTARLDVTVTLSDNTFVLSSTVGTDAQKACINTAITNITYTTTGATGIGTPTNLPSGVTSVWASNKITISGTPTVAGTFNYSIPLTGGCGSGGAATGTITVNALPLAPTLTTTQPTCTVQTGAITILSATGATYSFDGGAFLSTLVYSGLAQGTSHTVCEKNASGCISSVANSTINSLVTNTYTAGRWSVGSAPPTINGAQNIVFNGAFAASTNLSGCSCTVNSGNVTINSGVALIVTNAVNVNAPGTLTFENNASLVQTNDVINSGNITYKRNISSSLTTDYTYWSSPVVDQNLNLSPFYVSGMYYSFDASSEKWIKATATTNMDRGKGYIIRGPVTSLPPGFYAATFAGVPNNGDITITAAAGIKSNLIGNPYPSAIDADAFINANSAAIDGTLYFWTHNTALQNRNNILLTAGEGALAYTSNDYAVYNLTGGVVIDAVKYVQGGTSAPSGGVKPTGKIAAGQSFFTTSTIVGGTVTFNNLMRVDGSGNPLNNSNFYKTKNPKSKLATTFEKHRVWLNLSNTQGAFKQTLIGYTTDATNEFDSRFDGESFDGNEFVDFYSINQNKNLVIQGRALPFDQNDEVPLGYRTTINGNFTVNIDETDGLLSNQEVFLEDKLANKTVNLKQGNHTFNTKAGIFDNRFVLRYTDKTLATTDFNAKENNVLVSIKNKKLQINSFATTIDKVTIFDLLGRQIYQKNKVNNNELLLSDFVPSDQVLIIKTSLQNGNTVTEKVIY